MPQISQHPGDGREGPEPRGSGDHGSSDGRSVLSRLRSGLQHTAETAAHAVSAAKEVVEKLRPQRKPEPWELDEPPSEPYFRHVGTFWRLVGLLFVIALVAGWILYHGHELPFWEMRWQLFDSTGYQPPRSSHYALDSIPRHIAGQVGATPELPLPGGSVNAPPAAVLALVNPVAGDARSIRNGARLYVDNCMMCHGTNGHGDGPVGESYTPKPADLTLQVPAHPDSVLFWIITDGVVSTPTPEAAKYLPHDFMAFRHILSELERWEIISWEKARWGGRGVPEVDPVLAERQAIAADQMEATGGEAVMGLPEGARGERDLANGEAAAGTEGPQPMDEPPGEREPGATGTEAAGAEPYPTQGSGSPGATTHPITVEGAYVGKNGQIWATRPFADNADEPMPPPGARTTRAPAYLPGHGLSPWQTHAPGPISPGTAGPSALQRTLPGANPNGTNPTGVPVVGTENTGL